MNLSRAIAKVTMKKNISVVDVVEVLRKYNLLSLLPSIKRDIEKLTRDKGFEDTVHIESPFEIDNEALGRIKRVIGNDLAKTEVTINKNILAGFKARFKGKLYDGSAERIIRKLATH
jgi:F0F1-type ATP synthase delta subunit